jgi:hypothetical protein
VALVVLPCNGMTGALPVEILWDPGSVWLCACQLCCGQGPQKLTRVPCVGRCRLSMIYGQRSKVAVSDVSRVNVSMLQCCNASVMDMNVSLMVVGVNVPCRAAGKPLVS